MLLTITVQTATCREKNDYKTNAGDNRQANDGNILDCVESNKVTL